MKVEGKTFLVTGGGSGMGRELVLHLLEKGGAVAAVDIRQAALDETAARAGEAGARLSLHIADISDREAIERLRSEVLDRHGHLDGLFNNAGIIQPFKKMLELDDGDIERVMRINLFGTVWMTRAFLPHLLERPEASLVNTASMGGFLPVPGQAIYGASKAGVKLMTEALYAELLDTNVHVTVVFPGAVGTDIGKNSGLEVPEGAEADSKFKPMPADEAARQIVAGMERRAYRVLVGRDARLMDKLARLVPERATKFIRNQMKELLAA